MPDRSTPVVGSGVEAPREQLLAWAAQLVRLVCFADLSRNIEEEVSEPVRRIAMEMKRHADTLEPSPAATPGTPSLNKGPQRCTECGAEFADANAGALLHTIETGHNIQPAPASLRARVAQLREKWGAQITQLERVGEMCGGEIAALKACIRDIDELAALLTATDEEA